MLRPLWGEACLNRIALLNHESIHNTRTRSAAQQSQTVILMSTGPEARLTCGGTAAALGRPSDRQFPNRSISQQKTNVAKVANVSCDIWRTPKPATLPGDN